MIALLFACTDTADLAEPCDPVLAAADDEPAWAFDALLAAAPEPWGDVAGYRVLGCPAWRDDRAVEDQLWAATMDTPSGTVGAWIPGSARFEALIDRALAAIEDSGVEPPRYAERYDLAADLADEDADVFEEIELVTAGSERAVALFDPTHGWIRMVHANAATRQTP